MATPSLEKENRDPPGPECISAQPAPRVIGTLGEKTLHAVLKRHFAPDPSTHEITVGSFVADSLSASGIVEIQTRQFDKLRRKLAYFLTLYPVTVVYPVARTKWLIWIDEQTGEATKRRKSPKTGSPCEVFHELYKIKPLLGHENLRLCIAMTDLEEYRYLNGWSEDKKRGSSRCDRVPLCIAEEISIDGAQSYARLIPESLKERFTSKDFSKASGLSRSRAQTALNVLHFMGAVVRVGKQSNQYLYERAAKPEPKG